MVTQFSHHAAVGYITVFIIEAVLLGISLVMLNRIDIRKFREQSELNLTERAALVSEASSG